MAAKPQKSDTNDFPEVLAREIESLSNAVRRLETGRLTRRTIALLISDATRPKVGMRTVEQVLEVVENLPAFYLKRAKELKDVKEAK